MEEDSAVGVGCEAGAAVDAYLTIWDVEVEGEGLGRATRRRVVRGEGAGWFDAAV